MVDLSEKQADKAVDLLEKQKSILLYNGKIFQYIRIMTIEKHKGRVSSSNIFDSIHDDDDYHIKMNDQNLDLSKTYIRVNSESHRWLRLGSQIDSKLFSNMLNDIVYVYKKNSHSKPTKSTFKEAGRVEVIYSMNGSGMTLTVDQNDSWFNNAEVYESLDRTQSF